MSQPERNQPVRSAPRRFAFLAVAILAVVLGVFSVVRAYDPSAPAFFIGGNDGETIGILDYIVVQPIGLDVARITIDSSGTPVGDKTVSPGSIEEILLNTSALPNGPAELTVNARDIYGAVLYSETVTRVVERPTLNAIMTVAPDGTRELTYTFKGLSGDQLYLVFASDEDEPTFSADFQVLTTVDLNGAASIEVGAFPAGYGGTIMAGYQELAPVTAADDPKFHVTLLTLHDGVWQASNHVTITNPAPPAASTPPPPPPSVPMAEPKD